MLFRWTREPRMLFRKSREFSEAVQLSGGRAVILVHPFYDQKLLGETEAKYWDKIRKLNERAKVPIIVLEGSNNVKDTGKKLVGNNVFFVETKPSDPTPTRGWKKLHRTLENAGAKTILIGGIYAGAGGAAELYKLVEEYEAKNLRTPRPYPVTIGCAGHTYAEMIRHGHPRVRLMPYLTVGHYSTKRHYHVLIEDQQ